MAYKQHFIEWFSGKGGTNKPNFAWQADNSGTATGAMSDSIDGGFAISTGATNGSRGFIGFNQKWQFSPTGSVIVAVMKHGSVTGGESYTGLQDGTNSGSGKGAWSYVNDAWKGAFFNLYTVGASGATWTDSGVTSDTNWHTHKIELTSSQVSLKIDDVLSSTSDTNLPAVALQPSVGINTTSSANRTLNIRYMEVYNT